MYKHKTKLYPNPLNPTPCMRLLQQEDVSISGTRNPDDPIGGTNFTVAKAPGLDINALSLDADCKVASSARGIRGNMLNTAESSGDAGL